MRKRPRLWHEHKGRSDLVPEGGIEPPHPAPPSRCPGTGRWGGVGASGCSHHLRWGQPGSNLTEL